MRTDLYILGCNKSKMIVRTFLFFSFKRQPIVAHGEMMVALQEIQKMPRQQTSTRQQSGILSVHACMLMLVSCSLSRLSHQMWMCCCAGENPGVMRVSFHA